CHKFGVHGRQREDKAENADRDYGQLDHQRAVAGAHGHSQCRTMTPTKKTSTTLRRINPVFMLGERSTQRSREMRGPLLSRPGYEFLFDHWGFLLDHGRFLLH